MFLVPILLVATISISHVVSWYDIANPINWAIYLSIAIEVGAMTALVAATNKIKGGVWFMFGMVTLIQMIGNIFFSFKEIDSNGNLFKSWVELTGPLWEMMGSDPTDVVAMKRWLSFLEGGLLPIISLTSLHFFVKFDDNKPKVEIKEEPKIEGPSDDEDGGLMSDSVVNPTYEITKVIYENKVEPIVVNEVTGEIELPEEELPIQSEIYLTEKTTLPTVGLFASEEEYLDLQESHLLINEPVNEPVNDVVNEGVNEGVNDGVNEGVNSEPFRNDFGTISEEEGVLAPESVSNPTYEITKEIFESKEKLENMPVVETFVDESQYLTLQESHRPVIDTTETISDDIRQIIDEVVTTENTKFPMDMMLEFDDNVTTTTTTDDGVKRLSYVKNT